MMNALSARIFRNFFLCTAFIFAVTGCGSGGSSSSATNSATGSLAAKLIWSNQAAKKTAKTLNKVPDEVTSIKISVYSDVNRTSLITSQTFLPNAGSGTINGIPAGNGRAVQVEGIGSHSGSTGVLISFGTATVDVVAEQTSPVTITMEAPVTTAFPAMAPSAASFPVTLTVSVPTTIYYTSNEPATIYYTTNGITPTTSSPNGPSPITLSVTPPVTLKFFAAVRGLYEAVKSISY